jgi:hypothetical protein
MGLHAADEGRWGGHVPDASKGREREEQNRRVVKMQRC